MVNLTCQYASNKFQQFKTRKVLNAQTDKVIYKSIATQELSKKRKKS